MIGVPSCSRDVSDVRRDVAQHLQALPKDVEKDKPAASQVPSAAAVSALDFNAFQEASSQVQDTSPPKRKRHPQQLQQQQQFAVPPMAGLEGIEDANGSHQIAAPSPAGPAQARKGQGRGGKGNKRPYLLDASAPVGAKSKRAKDTAPDLSAARDLISSMAATYSDETLWQTRPKKRNLEKDMKKLADVANKVIMSGDDEGKATSDKFAQRSQRELRLRGFQSVRDCQR